MRNKWTNADAKRAESMGWMLSESGSKIVRLRSDFDSNIRFKNDKEAQEWVLQTVRAVDSSEAQFSTCRKAMLICAGGGE